MELEVKCFATLASYAPADGRLADLPENMDVGAVMAHLGVPVEDVKIIFVNGLHAEPHTPLKHGDRLGLFPAVGGG